ncbi:MAG: hypothetical protein K2J82_02120 [Muribaculaceae bacterium]|nr:hypothetical protein [Muribaculaceae bacterium]MDE6753388.1 hypothetical protein [Muribaculaceae bacterium]
MISCYNLEPRALSLEPKINLLFFLLLVIAAPVMQATESPAPELVRLREAADSLHNIGRTDSAVIVGAEAIRLAEKSGNPTQIVGTHAAQGVFLRSLGKVDEALESYDKALAIVTSGTFREKPDAEAIEEIASLYINLAVLNLDTQHKEQAAKNALLSGEWAAKSEDPELRSTIYGVVGSVLTGCGNLAEARRYQDLAYKDAILSGDKEAAFRAASYTMLLTDRLGEKSEAARWREKCGELLPEVESMMARLVYYQAECSICLKNDDRRGALKWFDKILEMKDIDHLPFVKFDCYNNMHIAYSSLGDYKNAYDILLKSNELRDSLWEKEKTESLRDLTVKYETKETELALAQSEAKRAGTLMWLFAALGLLLVGVILFVVYAGRQRRRRLQKEIEYANLRADIGRQLTVQYVEGLENERSRMSRELHDGVCNDLLAIQMNMRNGAPSETTAEMIDACRESVRRISHELMPPEFSYATIDEVVRFFVAKQSEANGDRVKLEYTSSASGADWEDVSDEVALEVYRILQEGVGNAVKHSGATRIEVSLRLDGGSLEAAIHDNGVYKSNGRRGIGLDSMKRRAASIRGTLNVESLAEGGTMVRLTVKNYGNP